MSLAILLIWLIAACWWERKGHFRVFTDVSDKHRAPNPEWTRRHREDINWKQNYYMKRFQPKGIKRKGIENRILLTFKKEEPIK